MSTTAKHQVLIVGGGTAGITVAARMLRKGYTDVAVIEPSDKHYYQPLWTLVGGGQAKAASTERAESSVMPWGATWIRKAVSAFDPDNNTVTCTDGATYGYDVLVVAPGIQLDWDDYEGPRIRAGPRWCVIELPVRSRTEDVGLHPQHPFGHRGVHHADRRGEVRGRGPEDRLPRRRPLAEDGRAEGHRRASGGAGSADLRHPGSPTTWTR